MKPYYIQNIPPILEKWNLKLGAAAMRFWQDGTEFTKGNDAQGNYTYVHRVRMLDHDHLSKWSLTKKHPASNNSKLISREPWLNTRKGDVIRNIQKAWNGTQHDPKFMAFPDTLVFKTPGTLLTSPGIGNKNVPYCNPSTNDDKWADAVDAFGLWDKDSSADGLTIGEAAASVVGLNDPKDDYFLAVGNFDWRFLPMGSAELLPAQDGTPDRLRVTFTEVGIYAYDTYDFNGNQPLGYWDVDAEVLQLTPGPAALWSHGILSAPKDVDSDPAYKKNMGLVRIGNSSFRCYRDKTKMGRDFLLYSDVKPVKLSGNRGFTFELQSGKPVG